MEDTMRLAHSGWSQEETDQLWKEIREAADTGAPLRGVFERLGQALGRKPNSVRNYYYMQLREQGGEACRRAAPFDPFTEEEIHLLLRHVLEDRGQGKSVRASVMDLSGGDKSLMLRYQNKYRALLRKRPELIEQICRELRQEGLPCPECAPPAPSPSPAPFSSADPDVNSILSGLSGLIQRAGKNSAPESDRLKVQRDLLMLQLEDLQTSVKDALVAWKDFLGRAPEERQAQLPAFCDAIASQIARLETACG